MVYVYIWNFHGKDIAWGHASLQFGGTYISWWPKKNNRIHKISLTDTIYEVQHRDNQSYFDDKCLEASGSPNLYDQCQISDSNGNFIAIEPKKPDYTIELNGLDEVRLKKWWDYFDIPERSWSTLSQNCSTVVAKALYIGGGDDYTKCFFSGWSNRRIIWKPDDVFKYALSIKEGLDKKTGEEKFAINFIRRYCKSALGITTSTLSMDEDGLANALYHKIRDRVILLISIIRELDKNRKSDADDIVNKYVNLLKLQKGAPLVAVRNNSALKKLLIKVMEGGWTSSSERNNINFIKKLSIL